MLARIITTLFIAAICLPTAFSAQDKSNKEATSGNQVEVTTDEVSGKTIIKLKPQVLADKPAYKITMQMTYKSAPKALDAPQNSFEETVLVHVECLANKLVDYDDREMRFAVDGKPLYATERPGSPNLPILQLRRKTAKPGGFARYYYDAVADCQLSLSHLRKVAGATEVGIALGGAIEVYFDQSIIANIRTFASELTSSPPKR